MAITDTLVALNPADLAPVQQDLGRVLADKLRQTREELRDLREHQVLARTHGWSLRGLAGQLVRAQQRENYYQKLIAANEAGYLLIPNMPITVLAVRTTRATAGNREEATTRQWYRFSVPAEVSAPPGVGTYVDAETPHEAYKTCDEKGQAVTWYRASQLTTLPDFPLLAAKPSVMAAMARALETKVFDEIGTVENGEGKDPIFAGRIRLSGARHARVATFFIAWWVDPTAL